MTACSEERQRLVDGAEEEERDGSSPGTWRSAQLAGLEELHGPFDSFLQVG